MKKEKKVITAVMFFKTLRCNADDSSENPRLAQRQFKTPAAEPAMICSHAEWRVCDLWMEPTVHADT